MSTFSFAQVDVEGDELEALYSLDVADQYEKEDWKNGNVHVERGDDEKTGAIGMEKSTEDVDDNICYRSDQRKIKVGMEGVKGDEEDEEDEEEDSDDDKKKKAKGKGKSPSKSETDSKKFKKELEDL